MGASADKVNATLVEALNELCEMAERGDFDFLLDKTAYRR
jgi:hypothetical protein